MKTELARESVFARVPNRSVCRDLLRGRGERKRCLLWGLLRGVCVKQICIEKYVSKNLLSENMLAKIFRKNRGKAV